jgi:hypothetical protein
VQGVAYRKAPPQRRLCAAAVGRARRAGPAVPDICPALLGDPFAAASQLGGSVANASSRTVRLAAGQGSATGPPETLKGGPAAWSVECRLWRCDAFRRASQTGAALRRSQQWQLRERPGGAGPVVCSASGDRSRLRRRLSLSSLTRS